jgi:hypothetical protein
VRLVSRQSTPKPTENKAQVRHIEVYQKLNFLLDSGLLSISIYPSPEAEI